MPNIWHPFYPCGEGPFPTSLSPLEDLQKVVVRASQGNGGKFVGNEQPAQVPPNVDGQSPKDPLFPPVQSPEFHQVHLEVVV